MDQLMDLSVAKKLQTLEKIMEKAMKEALHTMDTEAKELSFFSSPEIGGAKP